MLFVIRKHFLKWLINGYNSKWKIPVCNTVTCLDVFPFFCKRYKKTHFFLPFLSLSALLSFSLSQSVTNTTFSMRVSVWMIALRATLPASSNRSVCVATLIVRHATDRASMTVMCVATWKLSATMESVCLSVPATLTMIRPPMNAEVGKVEVSFFDRAKQNEEINNSTLTLCIYSLTVLIFPRVCQVMSDLLRPWALFLPQLRYQQA